MSSLSPGKVLPKDMTPRQWDEWNRSQSIDSVVSDAISQHVAASDPHPQYDTAAEVAAAIAALNIASGTYTPTLTAVGNVTSSTAHVCQYSRVGSVVTVSGAMEVTTTAGGLSELGVSLPIASNFANAEQCGGAGYDSTSLAAIGITGDTVSDRADFLWTASTGASRTITFSFTFRIV